MASTEYERTLREVMPVIKASAAMMMTKDYGMKQQRIAKLLEVTQAAVSKYLNGEMAVPDRKLDANMVKGFVDSLLHGDKIGAQRYKCMLCQTYDKQFECNLMIK